MTRFHAIAAALALSLAATPALAEGIKAGDLSIEKPWARATPKGADVGAAYVEIRNAGGDADKLTGGAADFANVEVHEMSMQGNVMQMRELKGGLTIPAHGDVKLAPGGLHLMLTGLKHPLVKGEMAKITLTFERAGAVTVDFPIVGVGASGGEMKGGDMKGMKM
jgi:periplasmic copper chaperone A